MALAKYFEEISERCVAQLRELKRDLNKCRGMSGRQNAAQWVEISKHVEANLYQGEKLYKTVEKILSELLEFVTDPNRSLDLERLDRAKEIEALTAENSELKEQIEYLKKKVSATKPEYDLLQKRYDEVKRAFLVLKSQYIKMEEQQKTLMQRQVIPRNRFRGKKKKKHRRRLM